MQFFAYDSLMVTSAILLTVNSLIASITSASNALPILAEHDICTPPEYLETFIVGVTSSTV